MGMPQTLEPIGRQYIRLARLARPSPVDQTVAADVLEHSLMADASASSDYVRVKHPDGIAAERIVHVTSLPPASVVQSPVKMVLNRTTTNAAWSSPRTKESFEMQEALLYALDEDVIAIRHKTIETAARKYHRENVKAQLLHNNNLTKRQRPTLTVNIRTDRCSTCEFLNLEICVHNAYEYAKRYSVKKEANKLLNPPRSKRLMDDIDTRRPSRPSQPGYDGIRVSPRKLKAKNKKRTPLLSTGAKLPVSPLAPRYDSAWRQICEDARTGNSNSTTWPRSPSTKTDNNKPAPVLITPLRSTRKQSHAAPSSSSRPYQTRILKEEEGSLDHLLGDFVDLEDNRKVTDSECKWMKNMVAGFGSFYSLDVYGMMKLREAQYISHEAKKPCRLVTDVSVFLMEKVLFSSTEQRITPKQMTREEQDFRNLCARVMYELMHSVYEKNGEGFTYFAQARKSFKLISCTLEPMLQDVDKEIKHICQNGDVCILLPLTF